MILATGKTEVLFRPLAFRLKLYSHGSDKHVKPWLRGETCAVSKDAHRSDGSVVKSTYCPCRGPMFSSQYPYDDLQPSVTLLNALWPLWAGHKHGIERYMQAKHLYT